MLPSGLRIRGDRNFYLLSRSGSRIRGRFVDVSYIKSQHLSDNTKFAINVTKKVYSQAVKRNLARRRLLSVIARWRDKFPLNGYLVLFRIKPGFLLLKQSEIEQLIIEISANIR